MKILRFISNDIDGFGDYILQEIAEPLKMNDNTAYKNLNKLVGIGMLAKTTPKGDKRERYFSIADKNLAQKSN
jgi:DNA-binding MarR family transcriptional regulator